MIGGNARDVLMALNLIGKAMELAEKYEEQGMTFEDAVDKAAIEVYGAHIDEIKSIREKNRE